MSALLDRYTFYLTHNGDTRQIIPQQDDVSIQPVKESGQVFFRLRIKNDIILRTDDFEWLYAIETGEDRCLPVVLEIFKIIHGADDELQYSAKAFCDDFDFDPDFCEARLKIEAQDPYTTLTNLWEKEINILDGTTKVAVNTNFKYISSPLSTFEEIHTEETIPISFGGANDFSDPDFPDPDNGWVMISDKVVVIDSGGLFARRNAVFMREITTGTYVFPNEPSGGINPGGWKIVDFTGSPYKFARFIDSFEKVEETQVVTYYFGMVPGVWTFDSYDKKFAWIPNEVDKYTNGVTLGAVLAKLLTGSGLTVKSNIFNINPAGASPDNDVYNNQNHHGIVVYQRSDCVRPTGSNPATIFNISLKTLLDQLQKQFQVYATVDGSDLVIEHVSFYDGAQGLDLTTADYIKFLNGYSGYTYDRRELPIGEAYYHESEGDCQEAFKRWRFSYEILPNPDIPENCLTRPGPIKETVADKSCNDLQSMISKPSSFSDQGITFVGTFTYEDQRMLDVDGFFRAANYRMAPLFLQLYWFHRRYYFYGEYRKPGSVQYFHFLTLIRTKRQKEFAIKLPNLPDINFLEQQKTTLGWGEIEQADYSLKTGMLKLTLLHE